MGTDLSSSGGGNANPQGLLGGISTHGTGRFETAIEAAQERIAADPNQAIGVWTPCVRLFSHGPFPRSGEHASARLRAQAGNTHYSGSPIQHRGAKGRPGGDGPRSQVRPGESAGRNTGWPTKRLSLWPVPAAYRPRGGHPAAPWSWPCKSRWTRIRSELPGLTSGVGSRLRECCRRNKERHGGARTFQGPGRRIRRRPCPGSFGRALPDRRRSPAI